MNDFTELELINIFNMTNYRQRQYKRDIESIEKLENIKIKTLNLLCNISPHKNWMPGSEGFITAT
jgi:hypothetical protein